MNTKLDRARPLAVVAMGIFWLFCKQGSVQAQSASSAINGNVAASSTMTDDTKLSEIIVTAEKRSERLQDVPVSVTVLNPDSLADNNQTKIRDYFAAVPGLNMVDTGPGQQNLSIRGLTTGYATNPVVAFIIDDVPYGSSSNNGGGEGLYPDIDPSDLARIEVLKGPQGTLYGADSLGGLIKIVTKDPSTDAFSGSIGVLGDNVDHGGSGYGVRGGVNIPLSDTVAMRISGFTRRDPGYIENITTGQRDINQQDVYGGHIAALWRPSDDFSLKLSVLSQHTNANGGNLINSNSTIHPTMGLEQTGLLGAGTYATDVRLYSATINAKLAGLDFVSITGYGINKWNYTEDITPILVSFAQSDFGVSAVTQWNSQETKKFTQEFRLSSPSAERLEWMVGVFYTNEETPEAQALIANNLSTGSPVGSLIYFEEPSTVSEYAVFGDLTAHFTDRFDVQFGARESEHRQAFYTTVTGPLTPILEGAPSPYVDPNQYEKGNAFTYLVTPRFKISSDLMVYARLATGYRLGGTNPGGGTFGLPRSYSPDRTTNYELGIKSDLFDHALTLDASAYYVAWKDIQLGLHDATHGINYTGNGGTAKSEGLELSAQARPVQGLSISAVAALNKAVLTQDLPPTSTAYALSGDRLPFSSRFSGSVTADQDIVHIGQATGFVGASVSYVGLRESGFQASPATPRFQYPAYTTINVHAGARYESWLFNLFVNNVGDKRGILGGNTAYGIGSSGYYAAIIQPRTVGLDISKKF